MRRLLETVGEQGRRLAELELRVRELEAKT